MGRRNGRIDPAHCNLPALLHILQRCRVQGLCHRNVIFWQLRESVSIACYSCQRQGASADKLQVKAATYPKA